MPRSGQTEIVATWWIGSIALWVVQFDCCKRIKLTAFSQDALYDQATAREMPSLSILDINVVL